jgi:hypothetical protein
MGEADCIGPAATFGGITTLKPWRRGSRTLGHPAPHTGTRSRRHRGRVLLLGGAAVVGVLVAGCSSGPAQSNGSTRSTDALASRQRPLPAGATPSEISKMVCAREAQSEIAQTLGVRASVSTPTWIDHAYSCQYRYPDGDFVLTVKELSSWPQTLAYFASIGRAQGRASSIRNIGQGAYQTDSGWAVVRKDWKVLTVDISGLPAQFGRPPTSRADVAVTVADLILACWAGD